MKKLFLLTAVLASVFCGFAKVRTIPEISPNLSDQQLLDLTGKNPADTIAGVDSQLIYISLEGKIFRWDPGNKMTDFLINLNSTIDPAVFCQGNYLGLKQLKTGKYSILDLKEMKETAVLEGKRILRMLGLDREIAVYLAKIPRELIIFNYRSGKLLKNLKIKGKEKFYNTEGIGDNLFILSEENLYIYSKARDTIETVKLKPQASSGFLPDGESIYYGSRQRELVKFSLTSREKQWTIKIGKELTFKPQKIGEYIVIIPGDNNIYFFKKNGTLYWWDNLRSTCLLPPVPMKENVAVFMWDNQVKFFNYKKKEVTTYPLGRKPKSNMIRIDEYIYLVSGEKAAPGAPEEETQPTAFYLSRIGNHYGVEILTEPQYIKPMGKSVRFDLKSYNLIDPEYQVKILKDQPGDQSTVYEKNITVNDKPSFLWIPKESARYRLIIAIESENKKGLTVDQTFTAVDVDKIINTYYYELQCQSDSNWL